MISNTVPRKRVLSFVELAVNTKQLEALIKAMYAAASVIATDQTNDKLKSLVGGWRTAAKPIEKLLGVDLTDQLYQIVATGVVDEEALLPFAKSMRKAIADVIKPDTTVEHSELEMLQALSTYLVNRSELALKRAVKLLPALEEQALINAYVFEARSQKEFVKPLQKIVYALTKDKDRIILTADEGKILKEKKPEVYKEYLRLRKEFNQVWKDELRNVVFESKKKAVNYQQLIQYLDSKGIQNTLPRGFEGFIDANGKAYTSAGKAIVGLPGPGFSVQMNPEYDADQDNAFVFTTINDATGQKSQYVYTEAYRKTATNEKFEKVKNLDAVIDGVRKKWLTFVRKGDKSPQSVASTALELLYQFSARVGSMGNEAKGASTYGITTLLGKHFKIDGNKIIIAYLGKDGVRQVHKLEPSSTDSKLLIRNLKLLLADKEPKDRVFTFEKPGTTRELPLNGNLLNQWFQKLGSPVTVHKLRHVRGTRLFNELLAENEDQIFGRAKPLTEAQATEMFKKLATKVGQMLGHVRGIGAQQKVTPATAIQNYIDPGAMVGYFERLGFRPPKFLAKFTQS